MRVHIFDPQLNFVDGHYGAYDAAVAEELGRRGIEALLYGAARPRSVAGSTLDAEPVFSREMFAEVSTDPLTWPLENFARLGRDFHSDLARLGCERFGSSDLALFPNIIQYQIGAVRDWVMGLPEERRPTVVLKPSYLTHAMPIVQRRANKELIALLYRFALRQLATDHPRTCICTDTEEMARQFTNLSGIPVHLVPLPLVADEPALEKGSSPITAVYLGHASMLKGFHLLPDAIKRAAAEKDAPHFVIQCYGEPQLCDTVKKGLADVGQEKLTLIAETVDAETYRRLLQGTDIVLLPYAREFYGWASSGIFSEAMSLGKVAVATEGTWPAQQIEKFGGGGVTFKNFDAVSLADAITRAARSLPQLKERGARAATAWREHHCPGSFVDRLFALTGVRT